MLESKGKTRDYIGFVDPVAGSVSHTSDVQTTVYLLVYRDVTRYFLKLRPTLYSSSLFRRPFS